MGYAKPLDRPGYSKRFVQNHTTRSASRPAVPPGRAPRETMSDHTTIPLSPETRDRLRAEKGHEKSYEEYVLELLEGDDETAHTERNASPEVRTQ